ncbi:MAG: Xaa-Pro peptidase family protein [Oscillospiraceae bacterium]|nr:Xaa-Pro peptidase family protein [Oscillospiraceae bacterium]
MNDRLQTIRTGMSAQNLDALMLTSPINRRYITRFQASAGVVLILADTAYFLTDFRYSEAAKAHCSADIKVIEISREKSYKEWLPELLSNAKTLGFESDRMTVDEHTRWSALLPCEMKAAQTITDKARQIKDADEIKYITQALRIAENAFTATLPLLTQRPTERQVATELTCHMLRNGAEKSAFDIIVVAGENGSQPHGEPGDRVIEHGDFVTIDMGAVVNGYHSDFTRTVAVGSVTDEMRGVYNTVLSAQFAGINTVCANVKGGDIDQAARKVIENAGYGEYFGHGFGHGIGLEIHESISAGAGVEDTLPAGSTLTAEPGIYLPGKFGIRIEDLLVVTDNGYDNLSTLPKELLLL